ncbi:hypothetical protein [Microbulbifer sediminum]|uniref:hypothetical protein n=1 Tax=Microbulbifer sediminum TaxID=2904250 RepID=UPI001F1E6707|nr:hypothetical protein [Microbulbifer sediminum]
MKVVDLPAAANTAGGSLVSNKRDLGWEKEFLQQQSRYSGGDSRAAAGERQVSQPGGPEIAGRTRAASVHNKAAAITHPTGQLSRQGNAMPPAPGNQVTGAYKQVSGIGPRPEGQRVMQPVAARLGPAVARQIAGLRAYLVRLKGHLVVDSEGGVSIWIGKQMDVNEKRVVVEYLKAALRDFGLVFRQLTVAGVAEEL